MATSNESIACNEAKGNRYTSSTLGSNPAYWTLDDNRSKGDGGAYARTLSFPLPAEVADFIDHIHPTTAFSGPHSRGPAVSISQPASAVSATWAPASCSSAITPEPHDLDIQYTVGIATGVLVSFVSVSNSFRDGALQGFLDIVNFLLEEDEVPQVMSTSYDSGEADVPQDLAVKLCDAYMARGARGTSMLFSTGDFGVAGNHAQNCTTFQPAFSVGCPYVTAVGSPGSISAPSFSRGGFSSFFSSTPRFRLPFNLHADAVAAYLEAHGATNADRFNASGRASAQGENVQIIRGGAVAPVQGPLLNDPLTAGGTPPSGSSARGSANPDTTAGCGTDGVAAGAGWDPVTGLGTPISAKMRAAAGLR
ncbi:hypothetical protein B0H17DRAFT_1193433 [Mycena rosella]|uniref:Peptidase S53 domain-containing protein n=1 Tax=Mycena rosella TaxID=1033263 RepID=A0AAD7GTI0_MYCRO|nr:hypothetical protein B0H17DRAFT_1193433 [Mycena rosella]